MQQKFPFGNQLRSTGTEAMIFYMGNEISWFKTLMGIFYGLRKSQELNR